MAYWRSMATLRCSFYSSP